MSACCLCCGCDCDCSSSFSAEDGRGTADRTNTATSWKCTCIGPPCCSPTMLPCHFIRSCPACPCVVNRQALPNPASNFWRDDPGAAVAPAMASSSSSGLIRKEHVLNVGSLRSPARFRRRLGPFSEAFIVSGWWVLMAVADGIDRVAESGESNRRKMRPKQ